MDEHTFAIEQLIDFVVSWEGYSMSFEDALDFVEVFARTLGVELDTEEIRQRWIKANNLAKLV